MSNIGEVVDKLPFKKNATPGQIIMLLVVAALLFSAGWKVSGAVKEYFDSGHRELVSLISDQNAKVQVLAVQVAKNSGDIDAIRHYGWSNSDMQRWANQLDRANRQTVPAMIVPEVLVPDPDPIR